MEEILDRVDENDNIIGATTKKEAHEKAYAHRVAVIYVFAADGKLLVQRRQDDDNSLDHSAAGHVIKDESYDEAARRELREELGLEKPLNRIGIFYADERVPTRQNNAVHYFGVYEVKLAPTEEKELKLQKDEVAEIIPMSLENVAKEMQERPGDFRTGFQFTLNFYMKHKNLNIPLVSIK